MSVSKQTITVSNTVTGINLLNNILFTNIFSYCIGDVPFGTTLKNEQVVEKNTVTTSNAVTKQTITASA